MLQFLLGLDSASGSSSVSAVAVSRHWHLISFWKPQQCCRGVCVLPQKPGTELGCKQFTAGVSVTRKSAAVSKHCVVLGGD